MVASTQFDANGSCRINQFKALPPKNRRVALGHSHSIMTEYDEQKNQVDDRDNDS
jgi:hypothetical protein